MIVETNKNASTGKYEVDIKTTGVVAELEANKEVSIDVSNYSEPVEITPSSGKDGMEKTTITLTNISSGGSGADLEDNKEVTITENGTTIVTPTAGKDGMKEVTATVNVPSSAKEEQTKSVTITENGTTTVTPDSGKTLSSVSITTNVSGGGSEEIHQIVVADRINQGSSLSFDFVSTFADSNFQYITMGSSVFKTGLSSAMGKITRAQILSASSGDTFSLTDGTLTLTLTISSAYEEEGVYRRAGSFTGSGYDMGTGSPCAIYVY